MPRNTRCRCTRSGSTGRVADRPAAWSWAFNSARSSARRTSAWVYALNPDLCRRALALWHGDIAYDNVSATLVGPEPGTAGRATPWRSDHAGELPSGRAPSGRLGQGRGRR